MHNDEINKSIWWALLASNSGDPEVARQGKADLIDALYRRPGDNAKPKPPDLFTPHDRETLAKMGIKES